MTTAQQIADRVKTGILTDTSNVRWAEVELLDWMNEGQLALAMDTPDALMTTSSFTLIGGTYQVLPNTALRLISITSNTASGTSIRRAHRDSLNIVSNIWRNSTGAVDVKEYFYLDTAPREFTVYPANTGAGAVMATYQKIPATMASMSAPLEINPQYEASLINYIAYRCFSKDTEDVSPDLGRATSYYELYLAATRTKNQIDQEASPLRIEHD